MRRTWVMPPACTMVRADEVDEPPLDEELAVPDGVEYLAYRERRDGVAADELEAVRVVGRRRILQPEEPVRLQVARQTRRLHGRQPMMHVVQQLELAAVVGAQPLEELRHDVEIRRRRPLRLERQLALRRLVRVLEPRDAVGFLRIPERRTARAPRDSPWRHTAPLRRSPPRCPCRSHARTPARPRASDRRAGDRAAAPPSCRECPTAPRPLRRSPSSSPVRAASRRHGRGIARYPRCVRRRAQSGWG